MQGIGLVSTPFRLLIHKMRLDTSLHSLSISSMSCLSGSQEVSELLSLGVQFSSGNVSQDDSPPAPVCVCEGRGGRGGESECQVCLENVMKFASSKDVKFN